MHQLISLASPVLLPAAALLRPSFGHFPVILLLLCLLWIGLWRKHLPGFGRRATVAALVAVGFLVASWLPRIAAGSWGRALLTPAYYKYVILPSTAVQMTMLLSLLTAPLWLPLSWLVRRIGRVKAAPSQDGGAGGALSQDGGGGAALSPILGVTGLGAAAAAVVPLPLPTTLAGEGAGTGVKELTGVPAGAEGGLSRRQALAALSWAAPAVTLLVSGYGVLESQRLIVRRVKIAVPHLPAALRGLRIGQLTDVHVSYDLTPIQHLARGCELLAAERLDLMIATGDLCDNARQYGDVLGLIAQVPARLGHFACLGNHELHLPLNFVRRAYQRSPIHLLEDEALIVPGRRELTLGGVGFPQRGASNQPEEMLDTALRGHERDPFTLMLSHHPHVFKHAGGRNVGLMLSGHTHGGQVGIGDDRALIEPVYEYVRGHFYQPGGEGGDGPQLFVSSGLGHWLPFRVNCPPEVVVIELV